MKRPTSVGEEPKREGIIVNGKLDVGHKKEYMDMKLDDK